MKPLNAHIYGDDILSEVVPARADDSAEKIYVGDTLGVDEYPDRLVKCCVAVAFGKTFGKVAVPYSYPAMIERLGESGGFEVKRLTLDSPERDELYDITDRIYVRACFADTFPEAEKRLQNLRHPFRLSTFSAETWTATGTSSR